MPKYTQEEIDHAREYLASILSPGDEVLTILRHVTKSGMTRWIDVYTIHDGELTYLSPYVARLLGEVVNTQHDGIKVGGCGMDMGFHLVYNLSATLFRDGFACIGNDTRPGCPSNDHSNREERDWHPSGGYALRHRWL